MVKVPNIELTLCNSTDPDSGDHEKSLQGGIAQGEVQLKEKCIHKKIIFAGIGLHQYDAHIFT